MNFLVDIVYESLIKLFVNFIVEYATDKVNLWVMKKI